MKDFINITVVDRADKETIIEAPLEMGFNVMEMLRASEFGVEGTCGGMALCASCHCYLLSDHELPKQSEAEEDMLDQAFFVEDNSRLTCQIQITEDLDNIKLKLAPVGK